MFLNLPLKIIVNLKKKYWLKNNNNTKQALQNQTKITNHLVLETFQMISVLVKTKISKIMLLFNITTIFNN